MGGTDAPWLGSLQNYSFDPTGWSPDKKMYDKEDNWWMKYLQQLKYQSTPVVIVETPGSIGTRTWTNPNPAVHDALVKLTDQRLGYRRDNWRRWWENEKKNREARERVAPDRIVPMPPLSH